jgi:hypothetical protein
MKLSSRSADACRRSVSFDGIQYRRDIGQKALTDGRLRFVNTKDTKDTEDQPLK